MRLILPALSIQIVSGPVLRRASGFLLVLAGFWLPGCESTTDPGIPVDTAVPFTPGEIDEILARSVEVALDRGQTVVIAVTDRPGNVQRIFRMNGVPEAGGYDSANPNSTPLSRDAILKARTAAYLSSNQHGFTTLTACFITRKHFPPDIPNTPGGPLFGVPFSSLRSTGLPGRSGFVQPNGGGPPPRVGGSNPGPARGLLGAPGGIPLFKDGALVGGIGVVGSDDTGNFDLDACGGELDDEVIALGGAGRFQVPADERGDVIFLDGIRLLYGNASEPSVPGALTYAQALSEGSVVPLVRPEVGLSFPPQGPVILQTSTGPVDFSPMAGTQLSLAEVQRIIDQARDQAARTRAAIRRPIGSPARVFITVVDTAGVVLGIWRTSDATLFSYDVSVQKARTALAFSNPTEMQCGRLIRSLLGLPDSAPLAVTTRAVGFLAQDLYPPGIDEETLNRPRAAGPLFQLQGQLSEDPNLPPYGNGITIFPGGFPLYRNGVLVGAVGISGDGVDQDDIIGFAGTAGFRPPEAIRCDQFFFDEVRLPFVKFPRQPELE